MKKIFLITAIITLLSACQSNSNSEQKGSVHTAVVEEILQTSQYTYLRVKENNNDVWLALPRMNVAVGETYYYLGGLPMTDFESKELNRTFKEVLFLDKLSTSAEIAENSSVADAIQEIPANSQMPVAHTVLAEEVLQTSNYTYIRAKESNMEFWLAVAKMDAAVGNTYYFTGGLLMTDFESKELKRTFKEILFVDRISSDPSVTEMNANSQNSQVVTTGSAIPVEKKEVKIKRAQEDITISELYENKKSYAGKKIKMKGEVTKFSPGIMDKNWIHLQDGTDFSGKFDLTLTTDQEVKVGDIITVEGTITLDKDFGYGYFYEVIMENAKIIK